MNPSENGPAWNGTEIAVVGMAGRFPGAPDLTAFWRNLEGGVESIRFFSREELVEAGVPASLLDRPDYVRAHGLLDDVDLFDAAFFGYSPREAETMDPQQRLFLESCWQALEDAGFDCERLEGKVGVYGGCTVSHYLLSLYPLRDRLQEVGVDAMMLLLGNDKDSLATRVCHKLDLRGAAVTTQTGCSSSLVALHLACQGLLLGESDLALAGGVSVTLPQKTGYLHTEEGILSPDGHCRAFDAAAGGTVFGCGVGVVVLKRLDEALADGDAIRAVIRGSAVNNDGSDKVGFTAPSVDGQAAVIVEALAGADVDAGSISYLEAHGTATALGDSIEIAALKKAYRTHTRETGYCALGSVKTNIGHLEAAAGISGLIKTVLALEHRRLPPSLHFTVPHPELGLEDSPFYVNSELAEWPASTPRRAAVSSFGFGGTNVHVVLEEAPSRPAAAAGRPWQLLPLSARSPEALERASTALAEHLERRPEDALADVAYTLQTGRRGFEHRQAVVCRDREDAVAVLADPASERALRGFDDGRPRRVLFMFPGQGAQHADMARELYRHVAVFRRELDAGVGRFAAHLDADPLPALTGVGAEVDLAAAMRDTSLAQPTLFLLEHALARLWRAWGVEPAGMIGHSLGEIAAAALAGVLSPDDAAALVATRARLVQTLPPGDMVTVFLPEDEVAGLLGENLLGKDLLGKDLAVAVLNGRGLTTVAGPPEAVAALRRELTGSGVEFRDLYTSHAFHSPMMDPILDDFRRAVSRLELRPPRTPYVSTLTGDWIRAEEATDPEYWVAHLRRTSRFAPALETLLAEPGAVVLEVGPGHALTTLARQHPEHVERHLFLPSLPHPRDPHSQLAHVLETAAALWTLGLPLDWPAIEEREAPRRLPLPTYPFERRRYFIDLRQLTPTTAPDAAAAGSAPPTRIAALVGGAPEAAGTVVETEPAERDGGDSYVAARYLHPARGGAYEAPRNDVEEVMADIWATVLGVERVGIRDNFFRLGGNSLVALQAISRVKEVFRVKLSVRTFFEASTVAELAAEVAEKQPRPDEVAASLELLEEIRQLDGAELEHELERAPITPEAPTPETPIPETPIPETLTPATPSDIADAAPAAVAAALSSPAAPRTAALPEAAHAPGREERPMDFSLFFFSGDEELFPRDKYKLVVESARFADRHGFHAVWTPERHFHGFGGLYPSPSVLGAALAMVTEQLRIRAGSVVLPHHHPVRVAEEWSVVDNLSGGRIGLAFASGFHPNDFLFAPDTYAERRPVMFDKIEALRELWRGGTFRGTGGAGNEIEVELHPAPVQPELPIWITCSNTAATFEKAGEIGAHVLTSLIGLSQSDLAERIGLYRETRAQHGHDPATGEVALMIHTYLGGDLEQVRATVREPFLGYLRSHTQLLRTMAKSLYNFEEDKIDPDALEELLEMEFERYFDTGSLMGTPQSCLETIDGLRQIGVTELGCLLDFGVDVDTVLASLRHLEELRKVVSRPAMAG